MVNTNTCMTTTVPYSVPLPSHLVTALPGPLLSEVLLSSPILAGEDGAPLAPMGQGFEFGIDPSEDPELAMVRYLGTNR